MADFLPWTNLLPQYQSPQAMQLTGAQAQQAQAQTGLIGAQTAGADIANQRSALQLSYAQQLQDWMAAQGAAGGAQPGGAQPGVVSPPSSNTPQPGSLEDAGLAPEQVQSHVNQKFYVNPAWTPDELRGLVLANGSGQPGAVETITAMHDKRVQAQQAASSQGASREYDVAEGVTNAPKGGALTTLDFYGGPTQPDIQQAVSRIKSLAQSKGWDDATTDAFVREYATEYGSAAFPFSKYAADAKRDTDGVLKDIKGRQVLGSTQSGVSQADLLKAQTERQGQAQAAATAQRGQDITGAQGTASLPPRSIIGGAASTGGNLVAPVTAPNAAPAAPAAAPAAPGTPAAPRAAPTTAAQQNAQNLIAELRNGGNPVPMGTSASASASTAPSTSGTSSTSPGITDLAKANLSPMADPNGTPLARKNQLDKQPEIDANAGQQLASARAEMNRALSANTALKNALTGPVGEKAAALQTVLGDPQMLHSILGDPGSRQVLEKALGNEGILALENEAKGSQFRLGAQTMNAAINKLSASANMTPTAIGALNAATVRGAQRDIQKWGNDYTAFKKAGGNPLDYDRLYDTQYPNTSTIIRGSDFGQGRGAQPDAGGFIPGKVYRDKSGNTATYLGNGRWQ